jgi:hypothetical protein
MANAPSHTETSFGSVRAPQVAGGFYPAGDNELVEMVEHCLQIAQPSAGVRPKVIVAPHAGYLFSGPIAGTAYAPLRTFSDVIKRVVLIGPAHRVAFKGIATTSTGAWATPLGVVPVDWSAVRRVLDLPGVAIEDRAFEGEHGLEVQLPFIQRVFSSPSIVPLLVGEVSGGMVSDVLSRVWGGPETLIVVSSDLSHFHDADTARRLDAETGRQIELMRPDKIDGAGACGHRALAGALDQARRRDLRVTGLDIRNSADTRGGPERVVGYGAFAMDYADSARLCQADRDQLVEIARLAVKFGIEHGQPPAVKIGAKVSPALTAQRASFVTLNLDGRLRGCIGSVVAHRHLLSDVAENAYKAAFSDPRFPPLTMAELDRIEVSVSILSTPRPLTFSDESDLVRQVRPDQDGLILDDLGRRGLFLPSVWSSIPHAETFIRHLKQKAGLPSDHWSDTIKVTRYTTESFGGPFTAPAAPVN